VSNATTFTNGSGERNNNRRLVGHYAQASFSYDNYAFLEFTGRADNLQHFQKIKAFISIHQLTVA
jgi:hypothetical protein